MSELIGKFVPKDIKVNQEVKGKEDLIDVKAAVKFFGDFAFMGALDSLGENRKLKPRNLSVKGEGIKIVKKLKEAGVIDVLSGQIRTENLPKFFNGTIAAKVRDLRIEDPKKKTRKIAEELNVTPGYVRLIIRKLKYADLLEGEPEKKKGPEEIDNPPEKPSTKVVVRSRVKLPNLMRMSQEAEELDKNILELLNEKPTLYVTEIVAAFGGTVFSSDIERRVGRLAHDGLIKRSTPRVGGKKVTKVEKIDAPKEDKIKINIGRMLERVSKE